MKLNIYEANTPNIDVKNVGVLEVPEGKNVDDLPIYHFVDIAKKRGLSTVTRALNNLQVWNKNKDPKLSKWAGDMIDKVTKRFENQKNESISRYSDVVPYENRKYWYFTTHGLGPGMLPKGVKVLKTQEGQNKQGTWGDFICLDAILNTSELRQYDLIELAPDTMEECDSMTEYLSADTETRMQDLKYVIETYVNEPDIGVTLLDSTPEEGIYEFDWQGFPVLLQFNLNSDVRYEYTINGEGPYTHDSYEYIAPDVYDYVDTLDIEEDNFVESESLVYKKNGYPDNNFMKEYKSFRADDDKVAAKQVFDNVYSLYKTGTTTSEFQMDAELDTNKFWDTLTRLCNDNGFEYVIVSEDENFDDRYYTIKLVDLEEGYDTYI